jgi:hypothetical protein
MSLPELTRFVKGDYSATTVNYNGIIGDVAVFTITNSGGKPSSLSIPQFGFVSKGPITSTMDSMNFGADNNLSDLFVEPSTSRLMPVFLGENGTRLFKAEFKPDEPKNCAFRSNGQSSVKDQKVEKLSMPIVVVLQT